MDSYGIRGLWEDQHRPIHIPSKGWILQGHSEGLLGGGRVRDGGGGSLGSSPAILPGHDFEASRIPDHLVQSADHLGEAGPGIPVLLPAVQHELVEGRGAVWGRGQPVVLFNGIDHLQ